MEFPDVECTGARVAARARRHRARDTPSVFGVGCGATMPTSPDNPHADAACGYGAMTEGRVVAGPWQVQHDVAVRLGTVRPGVIILEPTSIDLTFEDVMGAAHSMAYGGGAQPTHSNHPGGFGSAWMAYPLLAKPTPSSPWAASGAIPGYDQTLQFNVVGVFVVWAAYGYWRLAFRSDSVCQVLKL